MNFYFGLGPLKKWFSEPLHASSGGSTIDIDDHYTPLQCPQSEVKLSWQLCTNDGWVIMQFITTRFKAVTAAQGGDYGWHGWLTFMIDMDDWHRCAMSYKLWFADMICQGALSIWVYQLSLSIWFHPYDFVNMDLAAWLYQCGFIRIFVSTFKTHKSSTFQNESSAIPFILKCWSFGKCTRQHLKTHKSSTFQNERNGASSAIPFIFKC